MTLDLLTPQPHPQQPGTAAAPDVLQTADPAVHMIRQKIAQLYADEPDAKQEIAEVRAEKQAHSKHQQFMYELSTSGKSLTQIQTEWHNYYLNLPDAEKHEVWQEFYQASAASKQLDDILDDLEDEDTVLEPQATDAYEPHQMPTISTPQQPDIVEPDAVPEDDEVIPEDDSEYYDQPIAEAPASRAVVMEHDRAAPARPYQDQAGDRRTPAEIKQQLLTKITAGGKLQVKHHIQSLLFGLGFGCLVIVFVLFSFFNEVVIAPFIQPSRHASATPIILGTNDVAPTKNPEVIIPKINVEIPLDFSATSTDETQIQTALESGVVHYPTTVLPGQRGNTAFFGHSSNNIFNPGKYKFAFVLLHELIPGDTFYLTYNNKVYAYQVYDKKIVDPTEVSILNTVEGKTATATLVTCDPPGTSLKRLVVWGEQVNPDSNTNVASAPTPTSSGQYQQLPGNGPTLWGRMIASIKHWL